MAEFTGFKELENSADSQPLETAATSEFTGFRELEETTAPLRMDNEVEASLATGDWTAKDSYIGASLFLEGVTLGWSDEAVAGAIAAGKYLGSEDDYSTIYKREKAEYESDSADFKEARPKTAMGLELAGSIVSPIAKLKTASTLTGLALRGATEGGIYALGASSQDDSFRDVALSTAKSAALGGGIGGGIGGAGWLMKKKINAPLTDEAGDFIPITIAADKNSTSEAFLQSFYRDIVGPSYGGKGVIKAQEAASSPLITLKNIVDKSKEEVAVANRELKQAEIGLQQSKTSGKRKLADTLLEEEELIKGNFADSLGKNGLIMNKAAGKVKNSIEVTSDAFRVEALSSALPVNLSKSSVAHIKDAVNPNVAMHRLEQAWSSEGFKSIKDVSYRVKPTDIQKGIDKAIGDDAQLQLLAQSKGEINNLVNNALEILSSKRNPKTGRISGEDFSAIRSAFGTAASKSSDAGGQGALMQAVYRKVQGVLDDTMMKQLSPTRQAAFKSDRAAWKSHTILKDAVQVASTKAGRNGKFTPDEWIMAIKKNSPREARQGKGPLRAQAESIASLNKNSERSIVKAAERLESWTFKKREGALKASKRRNSAELERLSNENSQLTRNMRVDSAATGKLSANAQKKVEAEGKLTKANEELAVMEQARTPANPAWFHSMAATGTLGAAVGVLGTAVTATAGPIAGAGAIVAGAGLGNQLSRPAVQKFIAGQTPFQQGAQNVASTQLGSAAIGMAPTVPRAMVGMLTGQQPPQQ